MTVAFAILDPPTACAALASASLQGGLVLAAVWIITRTWRTMPGRARCWLWRLAYLKLLASLLWITPLRLAVLPPKPAPTAVNIPLQAAIATSTLATPTPTDIPIRLATDTPPHSHSINPNALIFTLWCIGASIAALRLIRQACSVSRLRRRCVLSMDPVLLRTLVDLTRRFGLRRPPRLLTAADVPGPLLLGIVRPTIILPADLLTADAETIELVLAHELAHVRSRDLAWTWLGASAGVLFFFHPLVWLARSDERAAEEMACDELAIAVSRAPAADYARALLAVASRAFTPAPAFTAGVVDSRKVLEQRIRAMTHLTPWSTRRSTLAFATALLVSLVAIPPWRVVAQDKPAAGTANPAGPDKTTDAGATEDWSTTLNRLEIEELAQKDAQLTRLLTERSDVQRKLNDLMKVQGYGETHPRVIEMKKAQEAADLEVITRARKVKEALARRDAKTGEHQFIGSIAAATLRIQPGADGVIMTMPVKEGDRVKRGDLLMQLDPHRADAALARTEAKLQLASAQVARLRAGVKAANVSQDELEQKEAELRIAQADLVLCKQDLDDTRILTPIDGVVSDLAVRAGERVTRGQRLATVIETGALKLYASVAANDLADFAVGRPLTVRVPTYPNRTFAAQVARIAPTVDPATATVRLEATLTGDTTGLLPGMFATATLDAPAKETPKQP